jgi:hypothetical protein
VLVGCAALLSACTTLLGADKDYEVVEGDGAGNRGGGGGHGGSGGHGGGGPAPCTSPAECPQGNACEDAVCSQEGACSLVTKADGDSCEGGQGVCQGGQCACPVGLEACSTGCADVAADQDHCGACEHGCQGGDCTQSVCQSRLVTTASHAIGIAASATHVYWTDTHTDDVMWMPIGGGAAEPLVDGDIIDPGVGIQDPWDIKIQGNQVFWTESGDTQVWSAGLDGSDPVLLTDEGVGPTALTLDATNAYFLNEEIPYPVNAVPIAGGGNLQQLLNAATTPHGIAVDADYLYWTNTDDGTLSRLPLSGGSEDVFITGEGEPFGVAVDASYIYWTDKLGDRVRRAKLVDGTEKMTIADVDGPRAIAVDAQYVYWTEFDGAAVRCAPIEGMHQPTVLFQGDVNLSSPWGLALNDKSVFWTDPGLDEVRMVAKPLPPPP